VIDVLGIKIYAGLKFKFIPEDKGVSGRYITNWGFIIESRLSWKL